MEATTYRKFLNVKFCVCISIMLSYCTLISLSLCRSPSFFPFIYTGFSCINGQSQSSKGRFLRAKRAWATKFPLDPSFSTSRQGAMATPDIFRLEPPLFKMREILAQTSVSHLSLGTFFSNNVQNLSKGR